MHHSYPVRPLHKEWRTGYARKGRRLAVVFAAALALWVVAAWVVIASIQ